MSYDVNPESADAQMTDDTGIDSNTDMSGAETTEVSAAEETTA